MMLSTEETAQYLGVSVHTVRKMSRLKQIPCGKIGRLWRFDKAALDKFLETQYRSNEDGTRRFIPTTLEERSARAAAINEVVPVR